MSLFRTESSEMASPTFLLNRISQETKTKPDVCLRSDNSGLVSRVQELLNNDPTAAYLRNDHHLYCLMRNSVDKLNVIQVIHVRGHQDRERRTLTTTEKLNFAADKLATKAVKESTIEEPSWTEEITPVLVIRGKNITKREELMLSIAAEREEFEIWQSEKPRMNRKSSMRSTGRHITVHCRQCRKTHIDSPSGTSTTGFHHETGRNLTIS